MQIARRCCLGERGPGEQITASTRCVVEATPGGWDVDVADEYEELVVERIRSLLARGGVEVRTSFYSRY